MGKVSAVQCHLVFHLDFDDLAEKLGVDVDEIRGLWNTERLTAIINSRLDLNEVVVLGYDRIFEAGSGIMDQ